jgi:hypothetical protein
MITFDDYQELKTRTHEFFNSHILIYIENFGDKSLYLNEYYNYFLPKYISYFKDRLKINGEKNNYIVVYNNAEYNQLNEYLNEINKNLQMIGYNEITIYQDEEQRENVLSMINENIKDINVNLKPSTINSQPSEFPKFEPRRKKVKTIDDPNVYYGDLIAGENVSLRNIVSEDNDLIVECEIFT